MCEWEDWKVKGRQRKDSVSGSGNTENWKSLCSAVVMAGKYQVAGSSHNVIPVPGWKF